MCSGPLQPIPDPATGAPTCPQGYYYDSASGMCQCIPGSTVPISVTTTAFGLSSNEVDPVQAAKNHGVGLTQSGTWASLALNIWQALWSLVDWLIAQYFDAFDRIVAFIATEVGTAVPRNLPGFWLAVGSLISDILGVNLDGAALYNDMQTKGTLATMQATGAGLVNLLIGEFTNTASGTGGNVSFSSAVNADTLLPVGQLTPAGGVAAAQKLMGFVLASAVRQANVDGLVDMIPFGFGQVFEKYSEGIRTNLGIGRMMRFALKPIFQDLVATPMKWAINKQYLPTLLSEIDAVSAFDQQIFSQTQLQEEMYRHGYSLDRQAAMYWKARQMPSRAQLRTLHIAGVLNDNDYLIWMRRLGHTDDVTAMLDQADDLHIARAAALSTVEVMARKYLAGSITEPQLAGVVNSVARNVNGVGLLSAGEVQNLLQLAGETGIPAKNKHLGFAQLFTLYVDGLVTLQEVETALTNLGYTADAVTELTDLLLVKAKGIQEKNAVAVAKAVIAAQTATGKGESALATAEQNLAAGTSGVGVTL